MAQYIDKSALMAEIERRLEKIANASSEDNRELSTIYGAQIYELINLAKYINTLEVKEVDLGKELYNWRHQHFHGKRDDKGANGEYLTRVSQLEIAKHFYELGLKTQKGE